MQVREIVLYCVLLHQRQFMHGGSGLAHLDTKAHTIVLPPYTVGEDAYTALPQLLAALGTRPVVVGGHQAMAAALPRLERVLGGSGLALCGALHYGPDCTFAAAQAAAAQAHALGADVILGVGGGRALDTAKAVGDMLGLPVITLPTIAATCAAVTKLSVMYDDHGHFDRFLYLQAAPVHCCIDTLVIARAPVHYLRAGIGDSLAKHVESPFAARGAEQSHADSLGLAIAEGLWAPLQQHGPQALREAQSKVPGPALTAAALCCIVSTGYVSVLVREDFNGALAHSLYYVLESLPAMRGQLHGDVVAWGALVQLVLDGQCDRADLLRQLLGALGIRDSLGQMGLSLNDPAVLASLASICEQPDMAFLPYPITETMVLDALRRTEEASICSPT